MSCCCSNIYFYCVPVSTCNDTNFKALFAGLSDGSYVVQIDFLSGMIQIPITVVGGVVTLAATDFAKLNENYTYAGKVFTSVGERVNIIIGDSTYDCFSFSTVPGVAPTVVTGCEGFSINGDCLIINDQQIQIND